MFDFEMVLQLVGMVAFIDPVRVEAIESIKECHRAGIKVVMITGDHPLTAFSIARDLKLAKTLEQVVTGLKIEEAYQKGEKYFDEFNITFKLNYSKEYKRNNFMKAFNLKLFSILVLLIAGVFVLTIGIKDSKIMNKLFCFRKRMGELH